MLISVLSATLYGFAFAHTEAAPFSTDLIAGQHYDVGEVLVWNDADYLYVKYFVLPGYLISETHLSIETDVASIPQKNGNPIPGKFEYSSEHDPPVVEFTYAIPNTWDIDDDLFIAAHAVVCSSGFLNIELTLPDQVYVKVKGAENGDPAYFPEVTITGGTNLDGVHLGWCADTDLGITADTYYLAKVYSSYESLPAGKVEYPENLDLVNWILNQDYVGQSSPSGGTYTYGDVQRAIWALIDDTQSPWGLGSWSQARVDEILAAAAAAGEGFVPGCGEVVAIILNPVGEAAQAVIITIPVPCPGCETAWGNGPGFSGRNWAMYFEYTVQ